MPLIIKVPWKTATRGHETPVMAELVDLYRTLADLSGLVNGAVEEGVEGTSLAPLFDNSDPTVRRYVDLPCIRVLCAV